MFDMHVFIMRSRVEVITRLINELENGQFDCFCINPTEQVSHRLFTEPYFDFDRKERNTTGLTDFQVEGFVQYFIERLQTFLDAGSFPYDAKIEQRYHQEARQLLRDAGIEIIVNGNNIGLDTAKGIFPFDAILPADK